MDSNRRGQLERLARIGDVNATMQLAEYYASFDMRRSFWYYTNAAHKGNTYAMFMIGMYYWFGLGVIRNRFFACYYLKQSADSGHMEAQYFIGSFYLMRSFKRNAKYIKYIKNSALQGCQEAQYKLGIEYISGKYLKRDTDRGIFWLICASIGGRNMNTERRALRKIKRCIQNSEIWDNDKVACKRREIIKRYPIIWAESI